jgi:hypothetical protein
MSIPASGCMDETRVAALLKQAWEVEIGGVPYFSVLADRFPDHRDAFTLLARVEKVTGRLVEPIARAHGVAIDTAAILKGVRRYAERLEGTLGSIMNDGVTLGASYLEWYEELRALLAEEDAALADDLVAHERAAMHLMTCIAEGRSGGETLVTDYLARHDSVTS